jgi:hypothetical protein
MSLEDQRRAPEFAGVLEAAGLKASHSRKGVRSFRLAAAFAMLCVAILIAVVIGVRYQRVQTPAPPDEQAAAAPVAPQAPTLIDTPSPARPVRNIPKRVRHRRTADQLAVAMKSLLAWRSPTASLLKAPGQDMLKSLPRLGESLQTIEAFSPERFN